MGEFGGGGGTCVGMMLVHISTGCSCSLRAQLPPLQIWFQWKEEHSKARCKNEQCDVFGLYFGTTVFLLIPLRDWKRKCLLIAPVSATRYEWHHPGPVDWVNFSSSSQISDWFFPCGLVPSIFVSCHNNVSNTLYLWQLTSNWITSVTIYLFIHWGAYWCRSSNFLEISHYLGKNQVAQLPAAYWAFSFWSQTNLWVLMMIALLFFSLSAVMC